MRTSEYLPPPSRSVAPIIIGIFVNLPSWIIFLGSSVRNAPVPGFSTIGEKGTELMSG